MATMNDAVQLKNRIKEFRARHSCTQEELAPRVGVRRGTIVHIEKGRYNPSLLLAWRIARELGTTLEELSQFEHDGEDVQIAARSEECRILCFNRSSSLKSTSLA